VMAEDYPDYRFTLFRNVLALGYAGMAEWLSRTGYDKAFSGEWVKYDIADETVHLYTVPEGRVLFLAEVDCSIYCTEYASMKVLVDDMVIWGYTISGSEAHTAPFTVMHRLTAGQGLRVWLINHVAGARAVIYYRLAGFELEA